MQCEKKLPIGISDFKKLIDEGCVYVDKSLLIQEIMEKGTEVDLIPNLESVAWSAIQQIEEKRYAAELFERGVRHILYLGFAFSGKNVVIRHKFKDEG
ncbi:MAG: hypothetical protein FJZ63_05385 [Chlamydiae bacterium]|nr:hypothetical protein [Chlamydiota bacterium]